MPLISRTEITTLLATQEPGCVSLYLPTHRAGAEVQQDPIRLKNALREAEDRLHAQGWHAPGVSARLAPAARLLEHPDFWRYQSAGLAVFLATDVCQVYRLPLAFAELVVVTERFHLKPLLPLLSGDGPFYVLALSQQAVRLLACTRYSVSEVELTGVPQSLAETLQYDAPERQLQYHTGAPSHGAGRRDALFHGQGGGVDDAKSNLLRYCQQIDRGLHTLFREERAPLVLAGLDTLLAIYREANTYAGLLEMGLLGNPEGQRADALQAQAWPLVAPLFAQAQADAVALYQRLAGTGRTATDLSTIVPAAVEGRVEVLFVAVGVQQWGTYDATARVVQVLPEARAGAGDLLDRVAMETVAHGGTVYAVAPEQVPGPTPLAAIFRY